MTCAGQINRYNRAREILAARRNDEKIIGVDKYPPVGMPRGPTLKGPSKPKSRSRWSRFKKRWLM